MRIVVFQPHFGTIVTPTSGASRGWEQHLVELDVGGVFRALEGNELSW